MKRYALASAIALMAAGFAMPAAAKTAPAEPVVLAMASYAATNAGDDAATRIAKKKAEYAAHQAHRAKCAGDGCKPCADCDGCTDCADCNEPKKVARDRTGVCDPAEHDKTKVTNG